MIRSRIVTTTALVAAALVGVTGVGLARAEAEPNAGRKVMDLLCASAGGSPVFTPYAIARCQAARSNADVEIPTLVCEGLLGGSFATATTVDRPSRANWVCLSNG